MTLTTPSRIGVLADTHNNAANTEAALDLFRARQVNNLIHCGDVTSPDMLELYRGFQVWLVRGNNDHDWMGMRSVARRVGNVQYCGKDAELEFDGHQVAVCHGDDESLLHSLTRVNAYDWVFYGHSHRHEVEQVGRTKVLNPGALGGRHPYGEPRSVAVIHLDTQKEEFLTLG
jgi:putative phosphoesterase